MPADAKKWELGPMGRVARVIVGLALFGLALLWWDPSWGDALLGLLVAPVLVVGTIAVLGRQRPQPIRATGPIGHALNLVILIPLFALPATAGAASLFYGASMLVAAVRRYGTCEVTAISNAILGRDDQVGCPLFAPLDAAEARVRRSQPRASSVAR
jgi:hypothetical protein